MAKVRVTIEFQNDGGDISRHEKEITAPARSSKEATERQAQQTFADLQKDLILGTFFDALPDPDGLYKAGKQRFPMEEVFSSSYFDQVNAQSVWLEIQNTLINVRFLLATARGYKEHLRMRTTSRKMACCTTFISIRWRSLILRCSN